MARAFLPVPPFGKQISRFIPGLYGFCIIRNKPIYFNGPGWVNTIYNSYPIYLWEVNNTGNMHYLKIADEDVKTTSTVIPVPEFDEDGVFCFKESILSYNPQLVMKFLPTMWNDGGWIRTPQDRCQDIIDILSNPKSILDNK